MLPESASLTVKDEVSAIYILVHYVLACFWASFAQIPLKVS